MEEEFLTYVRRRFLDAFGEIVHLVAIVGAGYKNKKKKKERFKKEEIRNPNQLTDRCTYRLEGICP